MPLVPCQCTNCGAALEIDNNLEAAVCRFCGTPFIVEKAINNYKTINIQMDHKDEEALIKKGKRLLLDIYYDLNEIGKIAEDLSNISQNEFYPEFFFFAAGDHKRKDWLLKNSNQLEKKEIASLLFNMITRIYNKESFDDVKLNIKKNYEGYKIEGFKNDNFGTVVDLLGKLTDSFDSDMNQKFQKIKSMAEEELDLMTKEKCDCKTAITAVGYSKFYTSIVDRTVYDTVVSRIKDYSSSMSFDDFVDAVTLSELLEDNDLFKFKLGDNTFFTYDTFIYKDQKFPIKNCIKFIRDDLSNGAFMLLKLNDSEATIIKIDNFKYDYKYTRVFDLEEAYESDFNPLLNYSVEEVPNTNLKLVYNEGFSYKKDTVAKLLGGLKKFLFK